MRAQFVTLRFKHLVLLFLLIFLFLTLFHLHHHPISSNTTTKTVPSTTPSTTLHNILFSIASSSSSFTHRYSYLRLWYNPNETRVLIFLDKPQPLQNGPFPQIMISETTSNFHYTFQSGHRSAIRVARMVKEAVYQGDSSIKWFVFGDDDTVFFPKNVEYVLSNYDHNRWYYLGSRSESLEQNVKMSFDMAYGGGGFAISAPLAKVLASVLDSCIIRYPHLYGSDSRVFSCLSELGVSITLELGFHQFDVRGSTLGLLMAHPLSPALSLHHLDVIEPLFPSMNRIESLQHLFKVVPFDPTRIFQQIICYSSVYNLSISISWGYVVQIYEGYEFLTDLISPLMTFTPWRRGAHNSMRQYTIDTREYPKDRCKRPILFFFENFEINDEKILGTYVKKIFYNCNYSNAIQRLRDVRISSSKLDLHTQQPNASRRECCDIVHPFDTSFYIHVRPCREKELIYMIP
ncbi:hypothetical protein V2J09_022460 [Rumex salicifolius]